MTFDEGCGLIEAVLTGPARQRFVAEAAASRSFGQALMRMRDSMQANAWNTASERVNLARHVNAYDERTRRDGFHVLNDWDGKADRVNDDTIPIDVLNYVAALRGSQAPDGQALAILLDYYFFHLLTLFALRIWDEGDADANLDRLDDLLTRLQGADGSGQLFAANAATLLLIGTSHFEIQERGYDQLLDRVRSLNVGHRTEIALGHASSMGCHLRFGFEATYRRDTLVMRNDNVADYPWLCFALLTLMGRYAALQAGDLGQHEPISEGLLNGLSADARAFVGDPPASLSKCALERAAFREQFDAHREGLLPIFERYRPSERAFSPLSFFLNFSHNVLKGTVVDALLRGQPWTLTLNDLLTAEGVSAPKEQLATTLMGYARANPDRINGRLTPVIVYDPDSGREAFSVTMKKLRE